MFGALLDYLLANLWLAALAAGLLLLALLLAALALSARRRRGQGAAPTPTAARGLQLIEADGAARPLPALPATLGRAQGNTVVLADPAISATHARLYYDERLGAVCIEDLDSTNGLFVDGQPTRKNILRDHTRVTLGATTLIFRDGGYVPPARAGTAQGAQS